MGNCDLRGDGGNPSRASPTTSDDLRYELGFSPVLQSGFVTHRVGGHRSPQRSLTEGDGHLTIMVCETSEQRGGRRGHRR
jgi:hypothetical protein